MLFLNELRELILRPEVFTLLASIFIAAVTWFLNEYSKRRHNDYIRKEGQYIELIKNLRGFYTGSEDTKQKEKFLDQINQCWLYCPDAVIKKGYAFLGKMKTGKKFSNEEKEEALQDFILEIRKDLLPKKWIMFKRTRLEPKDFEIISPT